MIDYIELSQTTPWGESCAQVGSEDYMRKSRIEANTYIDQLKRSLGNNPSGSCFKIVHCPHDFGTYLDIRFFYDDEDQHHVMYMNDVENGVEHWDQCSKQVLESANYTLHLMPDGEH